MPHAGVLTSLPVPVPSFIAVSFCQIQLLLSAVSLPEPSISGTVGASHEGTLTSSVFRSVEPISTSLALPVPTWQLMKPQGDAGVSTAAAAAYNAGPPAEISASA